jgi:hypothetical protein
LRRDGPGPHHLPRGSGRRPPVGSIGGEATVEVFIGVLLIVIAMVEIVSITMLVNSNIRAGR